MAWLKYLPLSKIVSKQRSSRNYICFRLLEPIEASGPIMLGKKSLYNSGIGCRRINNDRKPKELLVESSFSIRLDTWSIEPFQRHYLLNRSRQSFNATTHDINLWRENSTSLEWMPKSQTPERRQEHKYITRISQMLTHLEQQQQQQQQYQQANRSSS